MASGFGYADVERIAETREVYGFILATVHRTLGDQPNDIVRSAANTVLESLKNDFLEEFDKKRESEEILGPLATRRSLRLSSYRRWLPITMRKTNLQSIQVWSE